MVCFGCCWEGCYDWIPDWIRIPMVLLVLLGFLFIIIICLYASIICFFERKWSRRKRLKEGLFYLFAFVFFLMIWFMMIFAILVEYNFIQVGN